MREAVFDGSVLILGWPNFKIFGGNAINIITVIEGVQMELRMIQWQLMS